MSVPPVPRDVRPVTSLDSSDHVIGPDDVAVTVVEYGDFECPNCKQAAPAVKLLLHHFEGRIRFAYRHFPLEDVHPHALQAAEAAECASSQGQFWPMHDLLFENQRHLDTSHLRGYAERLRLDMARYLHEMQAGVHVKAIRAQIQRGLSIGVRATPTFFVNDTLVDVSFGLKKLHDAVDSAVSCRRAFSSPGAERDMA